MEQDLKGKVIVVTGANSGIGLEACKNFALRGAKLALICRDSGKGEEALDAIAAQSKNPNLTLFLADFSKPAEVKRVGLEILEAYPRIDILCSNAGGANPQQVITEDGFELTLVSNHLTAFLLVKILLPLLKRCPGEEASRVVFTSSLGHKNSPLDFEDLNLDKGYGTLRAYGRSKLMNLLSARAFHKRVSDQGILFSSFHPGAVRTPIWKKGGVLAGILGFVMYPFMWSIERGADTLIWLATSDDDLAASPKGRYFFERKPAAIAEFATEEAADTLWHRSEELLSEWL